MITGFELELIFTSLEGEVIKYKFGDRYKRYKKGKKPDYLLVHTPQRKIVKIKQEVITLLEEILHEI